MSELHLTPEFLSTIKSLCDTLDFENQIYDSYHRSELGPVDIPKITDEDYETHTAMPEALGNLSDIMSVVKAAQEIKKQDSPTKSSRNKNSKEPAKPNKLTAEQKCNVASHGIEEITKTIRAAKNSFDRVMDNLRAEMEGLELKIKDISKAKCDFERDMKSSINERTKKYQVEKLQRYFDEKTRAKEALVKKFRLKTETMAVQKKKVTLQTRQKEKMGDVLHEVDFEQLDIENKQYLEMMDEKNEELLNLKHQATKSTQKLNKIKAAMQELIDQEMKIVTDINFWRENEDRLDDEMEAVSMEVETYNEQLSKLKGQTEDYEVPPTSVYRSSKVKLDELREKATTCSRKVDIAEKILRKYQNQWSLACRLNNENASNNSQNLSSSGASQVVGESQIKEMFKT